MYFTLVALLGLFVILEYCSVVLSNGLLELAKKEILRRAKEIGYQLGIDEEKLNNIEMIYTDKKIYRIINFIPIVNVMVNLKNTSLDNLDNILKNLIENKTLVKINQQENPNKQNLSKINKIKDKPKLLINNTRTSLGLALELKSKISEILALDISDNEKNNMIIELLESYEIIPHEEKIKVKKLEK